MAQAINYSEKDPRLLELFYEIKRTTFANMNIPEPYGIFWQEKISRRNPIAVFAAWGKNSKEDPRFVIEVTHHAEMVGWDKVRLAVAHEMLHAYLWNKYDRSISDDKSPTFIELCELLGIPRCIPEIDMDKSVFELASQSLGVIEL